MAHVIVLDSLNEDIFVCGQCKYVFSSLNVFIEHKRLKCNKVIIEPALDSNTTSPVIVDNTVTSTLPAH